MRHLRQTGLVLLAALLSVALNAAAPNGNNTLVWNKDKDRVDADVRALGLATLLERIATETGWQVFVEPGTTYTASSSSKTFHPVRR